MPDPSSSRVGRLRAIPMLAGLPDESLERMAQLLTEVEVPAGHVLMQQGQAGSGLLVIQEGRVAVEPAGRAPIEVGPGEFIGELALLTEEGRHTARVRARTPVRLLALSRQDFAHLLEEEPRIAVAMLATLAARLAGMLAD